MTFRSVSRRPDLSMEESSILSPVKQTLLRRRLKGASPERIGPSDLIIPRRDANPAPLSFTQRQIWVIDQMFPGNPAYNLPYGYRLRGPLDLTALEAALNKIIQRHDTLRTTFEVEDGEPIQRIHPRLKIKITVTRLDQFSADEREKTVQT